MMDCLTKKDFTSVGEIKGMELSSVFSRGQLPYAVQRVVRTCVVDESAQKQKLDWTVERQRKEQQNPREANAQNIIWSPVKEFWAVEDFCIRRTEARGKG